jgi:hypothetical protein
LIQKCTQGSEDSVRKHDDDALFPLVAQIQERERERERERKEKESGWKGGKGEGVKELAQFNIKLIPASWMSKSTLFDTAERVTLWKSHETCKSPSSAFSVFAPPSRKLLIRFRT